MSDQQFMAAMGTIALGIGALAVWKNEQYLKELLVINFEKIGMVGYAVFAGIMFLLSRKYKSWTREFSQRTRLLSKLWSDRSSVYVGETLDDDRSIASANIDDSDDDELYEDARAVVIEAGKASTSYIQRKLKVGYSRAARLIDLLEERGVVGPADGAKPREVMEIKPSHLSTDHDESFIDSESEI
jgi:DNA segregation ATPase FtsK/SpoIIIE-like protein